MTCLVANNAASKVAFQVDTSSRTITLEEGSGSLFPSPALADDFFMITVVSVDGDLEIMKCTKREGDVLSVDRGQEGTSVCLFPVGSRVEHRFTAGMYKYITDSIFAMENKVAGVQPKLTFDTVPTYGSNNPVTSDGIYAALQNFKTSGARVFTASGTFVVPEGVRFVRVIIQGGGGGGGGAIYW